MAGTTWDKIKLMFLLAVLSFFALSAFPNGISYFTQASISDQIFTENYGACESLRSKLLSCGDANCESESAEKVRRCHGIVDTATTAEKSACGRYAWKIEECKRRNVSCKAHAANLNACRSAVDYRYFKQIAALNS